MSECEEGLSESWVDAPLGDVCRFRAGSAFKRQLQGRSIGDIPFIKVSDMNHPRNGKRIVASANWVAHSDLSEIKAVPFPKGAVVFAKIGEALKSNRFRLLTRPTLIDNNMMAAEALDAVDPEFLYYRLLTADLPALSEGSALPYLRAHDLARHIVAIPPLYEQREIAHVLGALDDKIEANTRLANRCEALAQSLVALHPPSMVVGALAAIRRKMVSPKSFGDGDVEHFSLPAFDARGLPVIEMASAIKSGKFLLETSSVLISKLNPHIPRVWMARPSGMRPALTSTEFVVLVPNGGSAVEVLWTICSDPRFCAQLVEKVKGTTGSHQRVAPEDVLSIDVPDPGSFSDASIETVVGAVQLAGSLKRESSTLVDLRDALLPKLLSGELRVRDAESLVGEAV